MSTLIYKNSTKSNMIYSDKAISYQWYTYAIKINNKYIVNTYHYSPTTNRHIRKFLDIFGEDSVCINIGNQSLDNIDKTKLIKKLTEQIKERKQKMQRRRNKDYKMYDVINIAEQYQAIDLLSKIND